jgi:hypothetical protein
MSLDSKQPDTKRTLTGQEKLTIKMAFENTVMSARSHSPKEAYDYSYRMMNMVIDMLEGKKEEKKKDDNEESVPVNCQHCGWEGDRSDLRTAMIPNDRNPSDKMLYEVKTCPDCGEIVIHK